MMLVYQRQKHRPRLRPILSLTGIITSTFYYAEGNVYSTTKKYLHQIILLLVVAVMLYAPSLPSARPEYAVKESRNCPYCHSPQGPPQLNDVGVYYGTHNYSLEGFDPTPNISSTPEPTKVVEIGVHMNTWDVGLFAMATIFIILLIVYIIRL